MNISYKWLKDYINTDLDPVQLAALLTSIGLETGSVERVETIRGGLAGIVIGKVLTCVEHPDSDHLHITTVELGEGPVQIVCGAPNVAAGQTVVVATVGTTLYSPDGQEFKIKKSKIRGVESFGMICAEDEIGIGTSHDGIIVLGSDADEFVGRPAAEYYKIEDDYVLEVDLTPNRIDAASHYGVARDIAAAIRGRREGDAGLHRPEVPDYPVSAPGSGIDVELMDTEGCIRYCGITIEGVKVEESPEWLRNRLTTIGLNPINNIVDITNYILHSIGHPLHAFDASTLSGGKVVVRRAKQGSKFVTLDGVERTLDVADLMICDETDEKCIAGVFGGLESGVKDTTTTIFIESACFHPTSVRRTARRHGLSTDASFRYERGVDPNGCLYALKLAAKLICEIAGGKPVGDIVDIYPNPVAPYKVNLTLDDINRLIGYEFDVDTVTNIFEALEMGVEVTDGTHFALEVPTYRVDVQRPCDVIEDLLRIYGYNRIPMQSELHSCLSFKTAVDATDDLRRTVSEQLTGAGWNEILNNSLTAEGYYTDLPDYPADNAVHLLNPLSQDLNVMRQTLLFGGLESIAHNINRRSADLAFYEFGNVYFYNPAKESTAEHPLAPFKEGARLALWMVGNTRQGNWLRAAEQATFYDLRQAVANVLARCGVADAVMVKTEVPEGGIYSQALAVKTARGALMGHVGIVNPTIARKCDIKAPVYFAELDWNMLAALAADRNALYAPLPKTQAVKRDLSLLLDKAVTLAEIEAAVREADKKILRSVELFDVYEGDKLPAGKKSYAISITLQDDEKTLQDKYIDKVMGKIIDNLRRKFNAELR